MLEHVLNEAERLQAYRLAACIRARDEDDALLLVVEQDVKGHHCASQRLVAKVEQRMTRLHPVGDVLFGESRHDAVDLVGKTHLGAQEVYFAQEVVALEQIVDVGTDKVSNRREDADNLLPFLAFEFADAVVGLHHFGRFDIERLSCGRLVVNDAAQTALGRRRDGDDQTTVAHSRCGVLIDISLGLGIAQDAIEKATYGREVALHLASYLGQLGTGIVAYLPRGRQGLVDLADNVGEGDHALCHAVKERETRDEILCGYSTLRSISGTHLFARLGIEVTHEGFDGAQAAHQVIKFVGFHECARHTDTLEGRCEVEEAVGRQGLGSLLNKTLHLVKQGEFVL